MHRERNKEEYDGTMGAESTLRRDGVRRNDKGRQVGLENSESDKPKWTRCCWVRIATD